MFFYLSQFLSFLAMPLTIISILIVVGALYVRKKWGKISLWTGILMLWFFSNQFIANQAMLSWEHDFKAFDKIKTHEIGIVLTGVTNLSKTAYDRTFFQKGADRITHALQLYRMGKIKKILITGGQGLNPTNPNTEAKLDIHGFWVRLPIRRLEVRFAGLAGVNNLEFPFYSWTYQISEKTAIPLRPFPIDGAVPTNLSAFVYGLEAKLAYPISQTLNLNLAATYLQSDHPHAYWTNLLAASIGYKINDEIRYRNLAVQFGISYRFMGKK